MARAEAAAINRDISGARSALSDEAVAGGTSVEECQARCAAAEFRYMGLQWQSECYCGNEHGSRGEADASDCDPGGGGTPD